MIGIYIIKNIITGKIYIGSAVNIYIRWKTHLHNLKNEVHHSIHLQRSWNKHGDENFIFEILEEVEIKEILIEREQHYLDTLLFAQEFIKDGDKRFFNLGYNISPTAKNCLGIKRSKQTRKKLSNLWNKKYKEGYKHPLLGKKHSKETIQKQSISKIEKYKVETHPRKGKKHSKETIEKLKGKNKGENSAMFGKKGKDHPCWGKIANNAKKLILEVGDNKIHFNSIRECSKYLGVTRVTIRNYINNRTKKFKHKLTLV